MVNDKQKRLDNDTCRTNVLPKTNDKKKLKGFRFKRTTSYQKECYFFLGVLCFSVAVLIGFWNYYFNAFEGGVPEFVMRYNFSWQMFWRILAPQYVMLLFGVFGVVSFVLWF